MKRLIALLVILAVLVPVFVQAQVTSTVERQYKWWAEEKLTVSSTVKQLSSEEYNYYYIPTRIDVESNDGDLWVLEEIVTDATTGACGILKGYSDSNHPTYLDIYILYNGADSADFDPNDVIAGADANCVIQSTDSYTRGDAPGWGSIQEINPQIAEIHLLDESIIWTRNKTTPIYSATDASVVGKKQYEGDTFYLFGSESIANFKAVRNGTTDAVIMVRYGY